MKSPPVISPVYIFGVKVTPDLESKRVTFTLFLAVQGIHANHLHGQYFYIDGTINESITKNHELSAAFGIKTYVFTEESSLPTNDSRLRSGMNP